MDDFFKNAWNALGALLWGALGVVGVRILQRLDGVIGTAGADLIKVSTLVFLIVLLIVWKRNYELLGAGGEPIGSAARKKYDAQRARLAAGGLIGETYERWLTNALDRVDVFFEGRERCDDEAPPTWTAPAYDRCLLLALIYPLLALSLFWAVSNHIGAAEKAILLQDQPETWRRALIMISASIAGATIYQVSREVSVNRIFLYYSAFTIAFVSNIFLVLVSFRRP